MNFDTDHCLVSRPSWSIYPPPDCDKNLSCLVHQRWQSALCEWGLLEAPVSLPVTGFQQRPILSIDHTATAWQWINNTSENG
jgi:hypothetical protein